MRLPGFWRSFSPARVLAVSEADAARFATVFPGASVSRMETGKIEISSQNHGFCVDVDHLPELKVTHRNLNDDTLEGFAHRDKPLIAIQFHPEAAPGPHDSAYFFRRFRDLVRQATGK